MRVVTTGRNLMFVCALLLGMLAMQGCASHEAPMAGDRPAQAVSDESDSAVSTSVEADDEFEDYGDEDEEPIADPWEPWNRFWFDFNDTLLLKVIKPVYNGYDAIIPARAVQLLLQSQSAYPHREPAVAGRIRADVG